MWRSVTAAVCAVSVVGCTGATTYGYQYRLDQQFGGTEDPDLAPVEARQLLAGARTVAFFPPDRCVNTDKGQSDKEFRANCGVLLSLLEREAEGAGYEVVSWVNLRGQQRPIDYAREAHVDVLFEINEFAPETVRDVDVQRTLTFFDRSEDRGDQELSVSTAVAERCRDWARRDTPITAALTSTIDIKTVSVADGRARWHYRKTVSEATGEDFPKVRFVGRSQPNKAASSLIGVGLASVIVGAVFAGVDSYQQDTPDPVTGMPQGKVFGDAPYYILGLGAVVAAVGIVVAVGTRQGKPAPEQVLCLDTTVASTATAPIRHDAGMSSQHRFSESTVTDPLAKKKAQLSTQMVQGFTAVLKEVHASHKERAPEGAPAPLPAPVPGMP